MAPRCRLGSGTSLVFSQQGSNVGRDDYESALLLYDTRKNMWKGGWPPLPFKPRAYHTATLLGHDIWVLGGYNSNLVFSDVWVLNTSTRQWQEVHFRCAHTDVHA